MLSPVRPCVGADNSASAHTMRGPNVGTGTLSGHGSTLKIASWSVLI
jgi:hypothetical protein